MSPSLTVEAVFRLASRNLTVLYGTVVGGLRTGDRLVLERADGTTARGTVLSVEFHRPGNARNDQFGIGVDNRLGATVSVGDVLVKPGPDRGATAVSGASDPGESMGDRDVRTPP